VQPRILQIIPTLDRCGAEKQLTLLAGGLPRYGFDVRVCVLTRDGPLRQDLEAAGVPVTLIGKRWKIDPWAYARLKRVVGALRPDVIHTWLFAANTYGRWAGLACGRAPSGTTRGVAGRPCLVAGERCVDSWKGWLHLAIDRRLARHTARIVVNSAGVRDFYVACGLEPEKFELIPNGVPPSGPVQTSREEILGELGLPQDARLVGLVGRLWPQKRVKDAIWAADLLKVIRRDVYLLVVGDGPHRTRLETFRDQVEIRDRVLFLGQRDDLPRLLPHFDVLWSTSAFEGQSNAIMEAMAAGVPVVATDIPGTRDLVVHDVTGYLVPTEGRPVFAPAVNTSVAKGLARYTNVLLDDPALARRLGQAARRRMLDEFSVEKMVARYADLYRRLLEPSGAA
jgi:glycosyltransferase involved in cell wall biosynthesis